MVVERVDGVDNHNHKHKEDPDFVEEASTNYKWTNDMEEVFKNRIMNHKKAECYQKRLERLQCLCKKFSHPDKDL